MTGSFAGAIEAGRAFIALGVKDNVQAGLRRTQARFRAGAAKLNSIGAGLFSGGVVAAAPFALAVGLFARLDDQLRTVKAVSSGTEAEFQTLTDTVKRLGRETSFTASEVAAGAAALGRAGFGRAEIDNALESVLALSRATGTELAEAADIAGNSLRIFGKDSSETANVADILTATANGSAQTLTDLFEALKLVGPTAAQAGVSIEQTSASLGILANLGVKGSAAGTALRRTLLQLTNVKVRKKLEDQLGITIDDAALADMPGTLQRIVAATANLSTVERMSLLTELFGARAVGAANNIGEANEKIDEFVKSLENAEGQAAATAKEMDAGIGGSIRRLLSAVEGAANAIGESLAPHIERLAVFLTEASSEITSFVETNGEMIVMLAGVVAGVVTTGVALVVAGQIMLALSAILGILSTAIGLLVSVVSAAAVVIGFLATPLGLVLGVSLAIIASLASMSGALDGVKGEFSALSANVQSSIGVIIGALRSGNFRAAFAVVTTGLTALWEGFVTSLKIRWATFVSFFARVFATAGSSLAVVFLGVIESIIDSINELRNEINIIAAVLGLPIIPPISTQGVKDFAKSYQEDIDAVNATIDEDLDRRIKSASAPAEAAQAAWKAAQEAARKATEESKKANSEAGKADGSDGKPPELPDTEQIKKDTAALVSSLASGANDAAATLTEGQLAAAKSISSLPQAATAVDLRTREGFATLLPALNGLGTNLSRAGRKQVEATKQLDANQDTRNDALIEALTGDDDFDLTGP